jgi:hypothetical protein
MASSVAAVGGGSGSVPLLRLLSLCCMHVVFFLCVASWLASEWAGGCWVAGSGRVVVEERGLGKLTRSCGREKEKY